jgi:hypothetical protein
MVVLSILVVVAVAAGRTTSTFCLASLDQHAIVHNNNNKDKDDEDCF